MSFAVGSLVRARGREWVVQPESEEHLLMLRPLGGTDEEIAGIHTALEEVTSATFDLPDPRQVGDYRSSRLLRDAVRISSRAGAGPFRSLARIAVEPRPYQLVPLLMALRLEPVRLLIADDVGVGKTIEACLIARELLDRGEIQRIAVLCPPHLAEQWQRELNQKFHIDAELVLPATAQRLERHCRTGESLFEHYPHVVVSMDFIKTDRRRDEFVRVCPEFVIVDEAHTCAFGSEGRGGRHQRHQLISRLAQDESRHVLLVTATPHSGNEDAFRSLLRLLDEKFAQLPEDLAGTANQRHRRELARHLVQRRRADIRRYLEADTPFPEREEREETYQLTSAYRRLFDRVLAYARETVRDESGGQHRQRVRWWSALALLRSLASSPAAAAATLRNRAAVADTDTIAEADELGKRTVFDDDPEQIDDAIDVAPGADPGDSEDTKGADSRLLRMAREAEKLFGKEDAKLVRATELITELIRDKYRPIVFCRFIPTVDYLAEQLRRSLPKGTEVMPISGLLAPAEREERILELARHHTEGKPVVLVCTDCLSEGINLQEHFDAVVHYDLAWNPTRHEQREGRVDRYGQQRDKVRVLTYYGVDNQIDGIVLDVLLRKHKKIRSVLGVSVPVPFDSNKVVEAVFEGMLLREQRAGTTDLLPGLEEFIRPQRQRLHAEWDSVVEREKRSRTVFAQESIRVEEVSRELEESRRAIGSTADVKRFTQDALGALHGGVVDKGSSYEIDLSRTPQSLRDLFLELPDKLSARFELPVEEGSVLLSRTHPLVSGLASYVMDTAIDGTEKAIATRAGGLITRAVPRRTTLLLCRFRFDIETRRGSGEQSSQIAEECGLVAFEGAPESARWLDAAASEALLDAGPSANIEPERARAFVEKVVSGFPVLEEPLQAEAKRRAAALLEAHRRVREAARMSGVSYRVEPQLPVDLLGIYVLLPFQESAA